MTLFAVDLVIKGTIVLAIAALADVWLTRRASAAARHFAWTVAIAALLALPFAVAALPNWSITVAIPSSSPAAAPEPSNNPSVISPIDSATVAMAPLTTTRTASPANSRTHFNPLLFAFALYSAGVVLLLARLATEHVALRRLTARADDVVDPEWRALLEGGSRRLGIRRPVRLLRSEDNVMPFTCGTLRPTLVLPEASVRWSDERRDAVILHELAHVARADCFVQRLAAIACACYWPHPGVWWAARRLRAEREFACDDRVLSSGTAAREYAAHLLEIAHAFRGTPAPATALGMARATQLEHRLLAVIDHGRKRGTLARRARIAAAVTGSALLLPIASLHANVVRGESDRPTAVVHGESTADPSAPVARVGAPAPAPATEFREAASAARETAQDRTRDRVTSDDFSGTWELRPAREPGMVYVSLHTAHSQNGTTVPLSRFEGLNEPGMTAAVRDGRIVDGTVRFASRREAGTFNFDGVCRNQMCGGTYSFVPDPAFPSRLAKYGVGVPTASDQYALAMEDVGVAYLEGIKAEGYAVPDVRTLVRAARHGVSLDYVKSMASLGYRLSTLEPLIRMRDHGVDPDYVKGMSAAGVSKLDAEELVRLRDHGVDPPYVTGMRDLGYRTASVTELVSARDHGVDPQFARGIASLGYKDVGLDVLVKMRDHGVDPEYVRGLREAGYKDVPIESLIRMRDHGVDPRYARDLASLGYKDVPIESLIRLRDHGVDPDYIRRLQSRGTEHLSVDDLIRRRDHGQS